jgi:hypothetical protein
MPCLLNSNTGYSHSNLSLKNQEHTDQTNEGNKLKSFSDVHSSLTGLDSMTPAEVNALICKIIEQTTKKDDIPKVVDLVILSTGIRLANKLAKAVSSKTKKKAKVKRSKDRLELQSSFDNSKKLVSQLYDKEKKEHIAKDKSISYAYDQFLIDFVDDESVQTYRKAHKALKDLKDREDPERLDKHVKMKVVHQKKRDAKDTNKR